jgi:acyl-CoA thioesterase FadM
MPRIKIKMPEKINASIPIATRITDHNYGNHVGNDAIVGILHEARVQWLALNQFTEFDAGGTSLIMGHLAVEYKQQIIYPCQLVVEVAIGEVTRASFELVYCIKNDKAEVMVRAITGLVCYDYKNKEVLPIPEKLVEVLNI